MDVDSATSSEVLQTAQRKKRRRKHKCHGNRKDQRFRQYCRRQNIDEARIEELLQQRRNGENINSVMENPIASDAPIRVRLIN